MTAIKLQLEHFQDPVADYSRHQSMFRAAFLNSEIACNYAWARLRKLKAADTNCCILHHSQGVCFNDPLVLAKLEVLISTAKLMNPFLKNIRQTMPFIAADLLDNLHTLMAKFIKESVPTHHANK